MRVKLLAISDTHLAGVDDELSAIVERLGQSADVIVHAGDYTSPEVVDYLSGYPFAGVAGNMDPHDVCQRLPMKRVVKARGFRIGLIHGFGSLAGLMERVGAEFGAVDAVVFGHSHSPLVKVVGGVLFVNPGSPFSPRHRGNGTVAVIKVDRELSAQIVEVNGCL